MMSFWEMHKRELVHFTQLLDTLIGIYDVVNVISDLARATSPSLACARI